MKICSVFKSSRKLDTYIYVDKTEQLSRVPEALLKMFVTPVHVMDIPLMPKRELAHIDKEVLLAELEKEGYYLQLPPVKEDYLLDLYRHQPSSVMS